MGNPLDIDEAIESYCQRLTTAERERVKRDYPDSPIGPPVFQPTPGRKPGQRYVRVERIDLAPDGGVIARSAHIFVELDTGKLWKADGWKRPARNFPRGDVRVAS